jgi:hypothetical protein
MRIEAGEHRLLHNGAEVIVQQGGSGTLPVIPVGGTMTMYVHTSRLKKIKQTKEPREYVQKYEWSEELLEHFKKNLLSLLRPDVEITRSELLVALGVWKPEDVEKYAVYDNQLRLLRESMYWLCDNGTLVASSNNGYMLPVSEEAKKRCRDSVEQRKSKSKV